MNGERFIVDAIGPTAGENCRCRHKDKSFDPRRVGVAHELSGDPGTAPFQFALDADSVDEKIDAIGRRENDLGVDVVTGGPQRFT